MNLILLHKEEFEGGGPVAEEGALTGAARIGGERVTHLREVLKAAPGDEVLVGLLDGPVGRARVIEIDRAAARLEAVLNEDPPPALFLTLVLALPRPHTLSKVLFFAAETGMAAVNLIRARRVEKSYFTSRRLEPARIRETLELGLMQGGRTRPPEVRLHERFRPFAEEVLPGLAAGALALFGHPGAPPLWELPAEAVRRPRVLLAVGPEGGWVPYEEERLAAAGLLPVSPGPSILRVEDAVAALAAQVAFLRREGL